MNLLAEAETVQALQMTDDRNMTTHTYREEIADEIYGNLQDYYGLMYKICMDITNNIS